MRRIGNTPRWYRSYNTCQCGGRVFHFSQFIRKLTVTEVILGDKVEFVDVETGVNCATLNDGYIACCALGERILLMAGEDGNVFAALVDVGGGRLSASTVHITALAVGGDVAWPFFPFLCQVSESRALLHFYGQSDMWYCDLAGAGLTMRSLETQTPTDEGFKATPILLPDGGLLVAGSDPESSDITMITCDGEPRFRKVGDIPGVARSETSLVPVGDSFVVGFGGSRQCDCLRDLWLFDLRTHRGFTVRRKGEWHPRNDWVPLVVQGGTLYFVWGCHDTSINSIPLAALAGLIRSTVGRVAFCACAGLPLALGGCFSLPELERYLPPAL